MFSVFALAQQEQEVKQVKKAYLWLKGKAVGRWQNLNLEQHAFSLIALRDQLNSTQIREAKKKLLDKSFENGTCWPQAGCSAKETAFAKLALDTIGGETLKADEWLLNHTSTPTGIEWYLQLTTEGASRCPLLYDEGSNEINIDAKGVMGGNPGNCFTLATYWLRLNEQCASKTFDVSCNTTVKANFLFKKGSNWYVTGQLLETGPQGNLSINVTSLCIAPYGSCDYEGTLWTAYAFFKQGRQDTAKKFLPYLIMNYENAENQRYMPRAFLFALTQQGNFANDLKIAQRADGLWLAPGSNNKYHDTALVAMLTRSNVGNITKTKETLLKEQKQDGLWECSGCDNIRDTAMILTGVWPTFELYSECERQGYDCVLNCTESGGTSQAYSCFEVRECCDIAPDCEDKWGTCKTVCGANETQVPYDCDVGKCCKSYNQSTCIAEIGGKICGTGQQCVNNQSVIIPLITSSEGRVCCLGACTAPMQTCSQAGGEICDPNQGKSCMNGQWIQSSEANCCRLTFCTTQQLSCSAMGGEICASDEDCDGGNLVVASDTGGRATCCAQGGVCLVQSCESLGGIACEAGQTCSGSLEKTMDEPRCCVNGECLSSCSSLGGTICNSTLECDGRTVSASDTTRCCLGKCKKPGVFPWWIIIVIVILSLVILLFYLIKTGKIKLGKPKAAQPRVEYGYGFGMPPSRPVTMPPRGIPLKGMPPAARQPIPAKQPTPARQQPQSQPKPQQKPAQKKPLPAAPAAPKPTK
ncbi:MAG: hypothetical protein K6T73_08005 [Candidatus Bathyarchaeota archaeon]|nr:hypothetical protein [Candidatus Bathyarchaeota archaeon]